MHSNARVSQVQHYENGYDGMIKLAKSLSSRLAEGRILEGDKIHFSHLSTE